MFKRKYVLMLIVSLTFMGQRPESLLAGFTKLDPRATYLRAGSDGASDATAYDLSAMGIKGEAYIHMWSTGDWRPGYHLTDTYTSLVAVFSETSQLLEKYYLNRIPGAVEAGDDIYTGYTLWGNHATDIEEDFFVGDLIIQVPNNANYIFFSVMDNALSDNTDPDNDWGVNIDLVSPIPAPGALVLAGIGIGCITWIRRRRTI